MGEEHAHLDDLGPTPPLAERLRGVLLEPRETFARHDASWGWVGPWAVVALIGVVCGLLYMARFDITELQRVAGERAMEQLPAAQRKAMDDPKVADMVETSRRFMAFGTKVWLVLGPPVAGIGGMLVTGGLLFGAAMLYRKRGARPDLMRALSVAAHAKVVSIIGLAAGTIGALTGNFMPQTSPANLVDPFVHPVAVAALSQLDPVAILHYAVLAAGLEASLRVPRRAAVALTIGAYAAIAAASIGFQAVAVALSQAGQQVGG
jgi:hypothetical protein